MYMPRIALAPLNGSIDASACKVRAILARVRTIHIGAGKWRRANVCVGKPFKMCAKQMHIHRYRGTIAASHVCFGFCTDNGICRQHNGCPSIGFLLRRCSSYRAEPTRQTADDVAILFRCLLSSLAAG